MVSFIIVSHSEKLAEGVKEMAEEMNSAKVKIRAVGGTGDGRLGTDVIKLTQTIEQLYDGHLILVFGDMGSSILGAFTAIDLLEEPVKEKVVMVDAPLVEGVISAVVQASITGDLDEIIKTAQEARYSNKF